MDLKEIIAQYLRESADKIESNMCGLSNDEIIQLAQAIMHKELNKTEAAELLNISTRTFDRRVESGELPQGIRTAGSNQKIWYQDELLLSQKPQSQQ